MYPEEAVLPDRASEGDPLDNLFSRTVHRDSPYRRSRYARSTCPRILFWLGALRDSMPGPVAQLARAHP
jgi:hypothetical protein